MECNEEKHIKSIRSLGVSEEQGTTVTGTLREGDGESNWRIMMKIKITFLGVHTINLTVSRNVWKMAMLCYAPKNGNFDKQF